MLTITRNDLVKAVAAVNKNVIVVGECQVKFRRNIENSADRMPLLSTAHSVGPIILESILSNANVQAIVWAG